MSWFKRKSNIVQPITGAPQKNVSERLEDAVRSEGNSSNTSREAWLDYVRVNDERIDHHDHEIRRLKIKKDIGEIGESSHKGFYRECTMTIRFFKHLYEFVIGEGLAPEKVQKYVSSAKRGLIVLGVVALASVGSSIYSYTAMRKTLEQNRDLLNLVDDTKNNTLKIDSVSNYFNTALGELEKDIYKKTSSDISSSRDKITAAFSGIINNKEERIGILAKNNIQLLDHADYLEGIISEQKEQLDFSSSIYGQYLVQDSVNKARIEAIVGGLSNQLFRTERKYNDLIEKLSNISGQNMGLNGRLEILERHEGVYLPAEEDLFKINLPLRLKNYSTE